MLDPGLDFSRHETFHDGRRSAPKLDASIISIQRQQTGVLQYERNGTTRLTLLHGAAGVFGPRWVLLFNYYTRLTFANDEFS